VSAEGVEVFEAGAQDEPSWKAFTDACPEAEVGHRWSFHQMLHEVFGQTVVRLAARRGETWVAVLPLVYQRSFVGRFLTSVPYLNYAGVLGCDAEARMSLARAAANTADRLRIDRLEFRGRDGSDLPVPTWQGKSSYVLDLRSEPQELWGRLPAKVRSQVKRPKKDGFEGRVVERGGRTLFYPLLARRWHELGSPVLPESFFETLEDRFASDLEYVVVERGRTVAAAAAMFAVGDRVEIPWAASAGEHDRAGVNMLLYWTALERATARGARSFDFGRSTPSSGNARFKLQWGAVEHPLLWNVRVRGDRGRASEPGGRGRAWAAAIWRRLPAAAARSLGPALAARVPL
jgi:FemAB-related protein (PEP-CTERM system-associated)